MDLDGEHWTNPPSIGCDEVYVGGSTGALVARIGLAFTNVAAGFNLKLTGAISGRTTASLWDFGDGAILSNRPYASHAWASLYNCVLAGNSASYYGGGAYSGNLNNCTVTGNSSLTSGGGAYVGTMNNCIIYYNSAPSGSNYSLGTQNYCCAEPLAAGAGNFSYEPKFVDATGGDFHLQSNSPCINAGRNAYSAGPWDLDGNSRISGGTVDLGAFEFLTPSSAISYAWLQQYGLATDGSADAADADNDGMNNWQEWIAGTDPTNAASVLRMLTPVRAGSSVSLGWSSVNNRTYSLESATNLGAVAVFSLLRSNIAGIQGTTSVVVSNSTISAFYRVRPEL